MTRYHVVPAESPVTITAHSTGHDSHATATGLTGTLEVQLDDADKPVLSAPYSAHLTLPVESIRSHSHIQDREMKRRLDTHRHPNIQVDVSEATELDATGRYHATAQVTVHGQTKPISGDVTLTVAGSRLVLEGKQVIDMRDFGIEPPRLIILKVQPQVTVQVRITAEADES